MSYKISLLHATRGRHQQAILCRDLWLQAADDPAAIEHIFGIDDDDVENLTNINSNRVIVPRGKGCVAAWNACAAACSGEILVQLSDDWVPLPSWDTLLLNEFKGEVGECVLRISDGHRKDDLLCMAILNRKRYDKQGFLFHPKFLSVFSDDYFTWCAKKDNVLKDASHIVFEHQHPVFGKAQMDRTYSESNSQDRFIQGHMLFNELTRPDNAKICLAMIVKNEVKNIEACLASVKDHIAYWVICDTGSTDGTQQLIKDLMYKWNIPGELHERPWVDFASNRTESLALARTKAEYTLIIDADDRLEVGDLNAFTNLKQDQYQLKIIHGNLTHFRPQLVNNALEWRYVGVLHEFLAVKDGTRIGPSIIMEHTIIHAAASDERCGYSGVNKYLHDALILEKALLDPSLDEGLRSRYTFYQAQSYRDAAANERSLKAYEQRVLQGGWQEEVYYSMYMIARLKESLKYTPEQIIDAYMKAWEYRASRVDALFDLIIYLERTGRYVFAYALATIGVKIIPTRDTLFVRRDIYEWRMADAFALLAMRTGNKNEAINTYNTIIKSPFFKTLIPDVDQERIIKNLEAFKNAP